MKVLGLASYPVEAASTRYRLVQFVEPLAERGIELTVRPFLDSRTFAHLYDRAALPQTIVGLTIAGLRRLWNAPDTEGFDVLLVQREAMLYGPPLIEWIATKWKKLPMILDLDDATYIPYNSPTYGKLANALKSFGKTDKLIDWSKTVSCGNPVVAAYVSARGTPTEIIPTVVDTEKFCPPENKTMSADPVIGWIGTHSTFPFLQTIFPVLQDLAGKYRFELKIVGAGVREINLQGVRIKNLQWNLEREIEDFQTLDIGLYPIIEEMQSGYAAGKSGFKAIQYMSVGIPYVVSPVGVCSEIGIAGETHLVATSPSEWYDALERLLKDPDLRRKMGSAGRNFALEHFTVRKQADKLSKILFDAARS